MNLDDRYVYIISLYLPETSLQNVLIMECKTLVEYKRMFFLKTAKVIFLILKIFELITAIYKLRTH